MEVRDDGTIYWNDQISEIADSVLRLEGLRKSYREGGSRAWIGDIDDDGLQLAIMSFSKVQIRMIEMILFEDRNCQDVMNVFSLDIKTLNAYVFLMHDTLLKFM